ncbi:hypothetical protein INR49_006513, partial [Caranx melampygus]
MEMKKKEKRGGKKRGEEGRRRGGEAADYRLSQGSCGALKGPQQATIRKMLSAVPNCFQLQ